MSKPITPLVGCDVFVLNERRDVLLIQRSDNQMWALPGGCQDLGESPADCAARECFEESGYRVRVVELLGVWSSQKYPYVNYPWTDNEFTHLVFRAELTGGEPTLSSETLQVKWFAQDQLPPLSDGHQSRIEFGYAASLNPAINPHFE